MNVRAEEIAAMTIATPEQARALLMEVTYLWLGPVTMLTPTQVAFDDEGDTIMSEIVAAVLSHPFVASNYHVSSASGVHVFSLVPLGQ